MKYSAIIIVLFFSLILSNNENSRSEFRKRKDLIPKTEQNSINTRNEEELINFIQSVME